MAGSYFWPPWVWMLVACRKVLVNISMEPATTTLASLRVCTGCLSATLAMAPVQWTNSS